MKTKYFLDTEFIENGKTIDLISIGLVCEDGREFYRQSMECDFTKASDWVWRNVFPHLRDFDMRGIRSCSQRKLGTTDSLTGRCLKDDCVWAYRWEIRDAVKAFCDPEKFGKPEFWGYYADYDWVVFCQLFGTMIELPKGFPMYCNDIKQLCNSVGDPQLPKLGTNEHSALLDAHWNKQVFLMLSNLPQVRKP